eukprot:9117-Heterococcus_DN1.PRE.2
MGTVPASAVWTIAAKALASHSGILHCASLVHGIEATKTPEDSHHRRPACQYCNGIIVVCAAQVSYLRHSMYAHSHANDLLVYNTNMSHIAVIYK